MGSKQDAIVLGQAKVSTIAAELWGSTPTNRAR